MRRETCSAARRVPKLRAGLLACAATCAEGARRRQLEQAGRHTSLVNTGDTVDRLYSKYSR
eukprot:4424538-Pyramimonas_sp.AAC.1